MIVRFNFNKIGGLYMFKRLVFATILAASAYHDNGDNSYKLFLISLISAHFTSYACSNLSKLLLLMLPPIISPKNTTQLLQVFSRISQSYPDIPKSCNQQQFTWISAIY